MGEDGGGVRATLGRSTDASRRRFKRRVRLDNDILTGMKRDPSTDFSRPPMVNAAASACRHRVNRFFSVQSIYDLSLAHCQRAARLIHLSK